MNAPNYRSPVVTAAMRQNIEAEFVDRRLVLAGEFAAEIEHLTGIKAELDARYPLIKSVQDVEASTQAIKRQAAAVLAEAEAVKAAALAGATRLHDQAQAALEAAQAKDAAVTAKETAHFERSRALDTSIAAHKDAVDRAAQMTQAVARERAQLAAREAAIVDGEARLAAKVAALAAREQAYNQKLDALRIK